jgi:hypothetical protein
MMNSLGKGFAVTQTFTQAEASLRAWMSAQNADEAATRKHVAALKELNIQGKMFPEAKRPSGVIQGGIGAAQRSLALLAERYRQADPLGTMNFGDRMAAQKRDPSFQAYTRNLPSMLPAKSNQETVELYRNLVKLSEGGVLASGTLRTISTDTATLTKNLGYSKVEIEQVNRGLSALSHLGAIRVGQRGGGQTNLTAGGQADYSKIFSPSNLQYPASSTPGSPVGPGGVYGGVTAVKNMTEELKKQGGALKDLNKVQTDGATQTTRWSGQLETSTGVIKNLSVVTGSAGQVLHSTARGFRSWGSAIARDIGEFAKWSIAAAAIYVPMRKLQDLFKESMELQTKLASIQISVGGSASVTAKAFDAAADVAAKLGVHLQGVMDGYVLAYRAAGQVVDPTQRAALATQLLADSMILSKLSGMEQAVALDTLVGSLRQLNMPLDQGVTLLDKWVAVTKVANVDLKTLSTSFAITATAAENAGLSVDRLNAIIAVVAETTVLSASEAGNAVRAFMSGFTRPESGAALARFGISIQDAAGELKSFDQISREIYERRNLKLIDDQAFAKLSETLGGRGARRGAQVQAYLANIPRVEQVAEASKSASGDAANAMAIQLKTLETATTRLSVAFSEMARALGAEGGFLDLFTAMTDAGTGFLNILNGIIKTLSTATPAIIALSAAMIMLKRSSSLQALGQRTLFDILGGTMVPGGGTAAARTAAGMRGGGGGVGVGATLTPTPPTGRIRNALYQMLSGSPAMDQPIGGTVGGALKGPGASMWGKAGGGLGTGLMMSFMSGSLMGDKANLGKAGSTIAASLVSQVIAGGNPIGGMIGGAIATALYDNLINREVDLVSAFERIFTKAMTPPGETGPAGPSRREELTSSIFKGLGGVLKFEEVGRLGAGMAAAGGTGRLRPKEEDIENYAITMAGLASGRLKGGGMADLAMAMLLPKMTAKTKEELGKFYDEAIALGMKAAEEASTSIPATAFGNMIRDTVAQFGGQAKGVFAEKRTAVTGEVGRGETGLKSLQALTDIESGFPANIATIYAAMTANNKKAAISFKELAELIVGLSEEETQALLNTASGVEKLVNSIDDLRKAGESDYASRKLLIEQMQELARLQTLLNLQSKETAAGKKYREFEEPGYVRVAGGTDPKLIQQGLANAKKLSEQYAKSVTPDPALQEKIYKGWGKVGILIVDSLTGAITKLPGEFDKIWDEILAKEFEKLGILSDNAKIGLEKLDIPASELPQLFGNMEFWKKKLQTTSYGSQIVANEPVEKVLFVTDDGVLKELQIQRTVFGLAYDMMIKNQEKQLEGIFNIPEGMTAMIPYTGKLFFSDQPIDKGADVGNMLEKFGPPVNEFTTSTGVFDGAVNKFTAAQEAKLARMEEEDQRQWDAAHPPEIPKDLAKAVTAPTDKEELGKLYDEAIAAAAEYAKRYGAAPEPVQHYGGRGGMKPDTSGDLVIPIFDQIIQSLMELVSSPGWKENYDKQLEGMRAGGPGEGVLDWIKSIFEQLGTLAETFSANWGITPGATGEDVQAGLSEAEKQKLLPTEGPAIDTSNISEDLKSMLDSFIQGTVELWDMFKKEVGGSQSNLKLEDMKTMGPGDEGISEWIKQLFADLGVLAQTFSEKWGQGIGGTTGGDVQKGLEEAGRQGLVPTTGPIVDTTGILEDLQFIFSSIKDGTMELWDMFKKELGIAEAGTTGGGKVVAKAVGDPRGAVAGGGATYLQPLSLPVTINTRIVNQTSILLDGVKIQQAINERQNTTLKTATRRAGGGGFVVEA